MKTKIIVTVLLACLSAIAQDAYYTRGIPNGRAWNKYTPELKLGFVVGYLAGIKSASGFVGTFLPEGSQKDLERIIRGVTPFEMTNGEVVRAIDDFYKDALNARIAIGDAMYVVNRKFHGETADDYITASRKAAADDK
jgi:hypothetical protein